MGGTSHVFLALKHDESVSSMWLRLLARSLMSVRILDDTYLQEHLVN